MKIVFAVVIVFSLFYGSGDDIFEACRTGDLEKVRTMLKENPELINAVDHMKYTPVHWAASRAQWDVVDELLTYNPTPDMGSWADGTALHLAAHHNNPDMIRKLVAYGYSIGYKNAWGNIPLHSAARRHQIESAKALIELGSDLEATTKELWTPLHYANLTGSQEMIDLLIKAGANTQARDSNGRTPEELFCARPEAISWMGVNREEISGAYYFSDTFAMYIRIKGDRVEFTDIANDYIYPVGKDTYFCESEPWKIFFERDEDGRIIKMHVSFIRQTVVGEKKR